MNKIPTLYNDNCLTWMKKQPSEIIDLTVTSPPYDDLRTYNKYSFDFEPIANELWRLTKEGGVVVWVVGDGTRRGEITDCNGVKRKAGGETGTSFKQALYFQQIGFDIHDTMIYNKNSSSYPSGKKSTRYSQIFEYMFVFSKGKPKTVNLIEDKANKWAGWTNWGKSTKRHANGELVESTEEKVPIKQFGVRNNIWRIRNGAGFGQMDDIAYEHPATYPEKLAYDHIRTWSNPGDKVFDPFSGSGTTLIMACKYGSDYVGCEMSSEYCEIINKRFDLRCPSDPTGDYKPEYNKEFDREDPPDDEFIPINPLKKETPAKPAITFETFL